MVIPNFRERSQLNKCIKLKNIADLEIVVIYISKYRGALHGIYNLKYSMPKKIPEVFHKGSNYDFIIKMIRKVAKELE